MPDSPTLNPGAADFSFSVQIQTSVVPATDKDYDLMRKGNVGTKGGEYKIEMVRVNGKAKALCLGKGFAEAFQDRARWRTTQFGGQQAAHHHLHEDCNEPCPSKSTRERQRAKPPPFVR